MVITILKVISVLVILAMMILLLVTMNHFLAGGFDCSNEEIDSLRNDVSETDDVISDESAFRHLVERPLESRDHKSKKYH